ncbi:hypothetical protein A9G11_01195 [Gilliamella sp. wkB108]|uniref:DUF2846 domain-containing protein n=1 Tax=Gilliamella sp. wkB108 TaxID=3120256 RepID=UPI00080EA669|nr:DUF2846 domain-containing protein [Gilliamella apicola]OCG25977.1 hypothetical protein A9G11_01195 [Gilliamella apicola]
MKFFKILILLGASLLFIGCSAKVDLADPKLDSEAKEFALPDNNSAGIYIFRDSFVGKALKKAIFLDGVRLGETADKTYFYKVVPSGSHLIETESEFSNNSMNILTSGGKNYFIRQFIKMGVFVGGADLEQVDESVGKKSIMKSKLIKTE